MKHFEKVNKIPNDLEVKCIEKNEYDIISVKGSLDTFNSGLYLSAVKEYIEEYKKKKLIFDFENLNYMSSTGVGACVDIMKTCANKNISVYFMKTISKIKEVLSLLGFIQMMNLIEDESEIAKEIKTVFPKNIECPQCGIKLKVTKSGKFRCSSCRSDIRINSQGNID